MKAVTRWTDQSIRSYFRNESLLHATLSNCAIASNCECIARVFDVIPALPHPTMPFEEVLNCLVVEELQEVVLGNLAQVKQYMEDTLSVLIHHSFEAFCKLIKSPLLGIILARFASNCSPGHQTFQCDEGLDEIEVQVDRLWVGSKGTRMSFS